MTFLDWLLPHRRAEAGARLWRAKQQLELRTPKWDEVEQSLGRPIPAVLRELYADYDLLEKSGFTFRAPHWAADEALLLNAWEPATRLACHPTMEALPPGAFAFASNDLGDPYFVVTGSLPDGDGPVFVLHQGGGATDRLANSLCEFLSWLRA
jgi:hypothetical protein